MTKGSQGKAHVRPNHITYNSAIGVIFDVPQKLLEVEVLEENPADVVVVDRVQDLLLRQGLKLQIGVLIVVSLISTIVNHQPCLDHR